MENSQIILDLVENLQSIFKKKLDPYFNKILQTFSFEEEVKWRYEYFENKNYNYHYFGISVVFLKHSNEDNYGFDICFKIDGELPNIVTFYLARGNGSMIIDEKKFHLLSLSQSEEKIDDLIYECSIVGGLLIKEYVLEVMYQS